MPTKILKIRKHLLRIIITVITAIALVSYPNIFVPLPAQAAPSFCAVPGQDGSVTVNGIINTYFTSVSPTLNSGATSITVGTKTPVLAPNIAVGDLVLIIQMQDADFNSSNTAAYGDNTNGDVPAFPASQPSDAASGWTNLNNTGNYEFVTVTGVSGSNINIRGQGAGNGLIYTYRSFAATSNEGRRSYQIIRVPQYNNLTLSSGSPGRPLAWNGNTGGVFVIDVAQQLTLGGGVVIEASGTGFRGGAGRTLTGAVGYNNTDYRTPATANTNASKGEGIAGTPRYVLDYFNPFNLNAAFNPATIPTLTNTGVEGYPNGSHGRGAPGNAGGGSTDGTPNNNAQNSGGGGGSNGGRGGRGGRAWSSQSPTGGFGGKAFSTRIINNGQRLFMGGGGGAGTTNNGSESTNRSTNTDGTAVQAQNQTSNNGIYSSGAAGGGIVIIRTGRIAGTGTIRSQGASGLSSGQDGAGVIVTSLPGVTIASGGLDGGLPGRTGSAGNSYTPNFDAQLGTGLSTNISANPSPGISPGYDCISDYGDAPDTGAGTGANNYQTTIRDGGASHIIVSGLSLGSQIDADNGTLQNTNADLDNQQMLVIARNNHIAVPYRSTNTTVVHKAVSIASSGKVLK